MLELYKNIKKRREELGLSQDALAKKVGYTDRSSIAKIESGKVDLPQSKILEIAEALRIPPGELMGLDGIEEQQNYYYLDSEAAELANEIYNNADLRILFDATRNISKEDLQFVVRMVEGLEGLKKDDD